MPLIITGSDVFPSGFNAPLDGEDVDSASVAPGFGGLGDRTQFLLQRMIGVAAPVGSPAGFVHDGPVFYAARVTHALEVLEDVTAETYAISSAGGNNIFERICTDSPSYDPVEWTANQSYLMDNLVGGTVTPGVRFRFPIRAPYAATLNSVSIVAYVPGAGTLPTSTLRVRFYIVSRLWTPASSGAAIEAGPFASTAANLAAYQAPHYITASPALSLSTSTKGYWIEVEADNFATPQRTLVSLAYKVELASQNVRPGGL